MANSLLTPTAVTREALRILHSKLNFIGSIVREYDDSFAKSGAKIGDSLKIRLPNQYTVRSGATLAAQDTNESSVTLQVASLDRYTGTDTVPANLQTHVGTFNPDAPALSITSVKDTTWIAINCTNANGDVVTSGPSGYGALTTVATGTGPPDAGVSIARREATASGEDPASFATSGSGARVVGTLAAYRFRKGVRFAWAS